MTETICDHDRLDVYRLAVESTAESFLVAQAAVDYRTGADYEYEHRFAEHAHEAATEPEPSVGPEPRAGLVEWMR